MNTGEELETHHLEIVLKHIYKDEFHINKDICSCSVEEYKDLWYIHITPRGSYIVGNKADISLHPLTRIIFWAMMLKKHPDHVDIFNEYYRKWLNNDLKEYSLIKDDCDTLQEMIDNFDTSKCICKDMCNDKCMAYNFHLILLAVLKHGWKGNHTKGKTMIKYKIFEEQIKFESGATLSFRQSDYFWYMRHLFHQFLILMVDNTEDD